MKSKLALIGCLLMASGMAHSAAIISDGNVSLGINDLGNLNVSGGTPDVTGITGVGMRWIDPGSGTEFESTFHGCECEGWGVGIADSGTSGYANDAVGTAGLVSDSFTSDGMSATSVASLSGGGLQITHDFALATETDNLFRVTVSIENTSGADISNVVYRRTFDWDTSPTPFNEFVTIGGTAAATAVTAANNNGFCNSNPFAGCTEILAGGTGDFEDLGPADHGSNFDFDFGALAAGETFTFEIFYGGAANEREAFAALGAVGAEVYSLGWSGNDTDQDGFDDSSGAMTPTYIFGFAGVGGISVPPPSVPEPGTLAILATGLFGMVLARRRKA